LAGARREGGRRRRGGRCESRERDDDEGGERSGTQGAATVHGSTEGRGGCGLLDLEISQFRNTLRGLMASGERTTFGGRRVAEQSALAREWRRLGRAATFVAVLTSPATFAWLYGTNDWPLLWALL